MPNLEKTNTPGIYRRGERYVVTFRDRQGRQRKETARTLSEARQVKAERTAAVKGGTFREASRQRLDDYLRAWIETYTGHKAGGFRENTREEYRRILEVYVIPVLGHLTLAELTPADVRALALWLHDDEAQGERRAKARRADKAARLGVSPTTLPLEVKPVVLADRTVARIVCPLSAALSSAVNDGLIDRNVVRDAVLPKRDDQRAVDEGRDADDEQAKAMTEAELLAFMEACPEEWRPFFMLLAGTGLRWSEACALRWKDLDLSGPNPQVKVRRACVQGVMGPPKSKASRRAVPLGRDLVRNLKACQAVAQWAEPDDLVFPSENCTPHRPENVRRRVLHPAAKRAGLVRRPKVGAEPVVWIGFHTFRHTCATRLFHEGRNAKVVQGWLGHHSAAFTLQVYVHLLDDDLGGPLELPMATEVEAELTPA